MNRPRWRNVVRDLCRGCVKCAVLLVCAVAVVWFFMVRMPGKNTNGSGVFETPEATELAGALSNHVYELAGRIGERNLYNISRLRAAEQYVSAQLVGFGFEVQRQVYEVSGQEVANLAAELPGVKDPAKIVVVGAHYDSVLGSPGANDNASGVAALLELARLWHARAPAHTVRFVAFVNEEPPFFQSSEMGSFVYARQCRANGDQIVAMLSLETMGCFDDAPGTQHYPPPVGMFYPGTGNFIGVVGCTKYASLVRRCVKVIRGSGYIPCEGGALPAILPGISWSDHWSFWEHGYPAVMITDTAPFRYPHYHSGNDTPDKLDYARLARVVLALDRVIADLVGMQLESGR